MKSYCQLAMKYLKFQKKRTILTILGVALASGVLFMILTLYFSNFINERDALRKEADYEMVFFTENEAKVSGIKDEPFVRDSYTGDYFIAMTDMNIENALFVNVENPYRMNKYFEDITEKYDIEGSMNEMLASYYLQGDIGNENYIKCLMFLLISFIFAIIGVGIIRNSIQLNTLEQVKDYGILRCVGATKNQLKNIIFLIGLWQELAGLAAGMTAGFIAAFIAGEVNNIKVGLHIVPVVFVIVSFIGDLMFLMMENSRFAGRLTPVEAVRGRLSVKNQKIKVRKKSLFGMIFNAEGDYAYKSLMANKGRFFKSVAAFGFGIAAFIIISVIFTAVNGVWEKSSIQFGEYEICYYNPINAYTDVDTAKAGLPDHNLLSQVAKNRQIESSQNIYAASMCVADFEDFFSHYDEDILENTNKGQFLMSTKRMMNNDDYSGIFLTEGIDLYGYDETEYASYESLLVDGTLDVSDTGIVIVRQELATPIDMEETAEAEFFVVSNYEVGDKIDIVDMESFQKLYMERYESFAESNPDDVSEDTMYSLKLYGECRQQLIDEGKYTTYTVEGIVEYEKDKLGGTGMAAVVPLENFYRMTGLYEGDSVGVKYKLKSYNIGNDLSEILGRLGEEAECITTYHYAAIIAFAGLNRDLEYAVMAVIFIIVMSSINIINVSSGNIYLRRQELAQLRVIGVSKNRLVYIVLMEGIIMTVLANIFGILIGFGTVMAMQTPFDVMYNIRLQYPYASAVVGFIFSILILCGSIYVPIKRLSRSVLDNLNAGGD